MIVAVAASVGAVTLMFSSGSHPAWLPPLWSDTNAMSRNSILLVGPVVAGIGASIGGWRHTLAIGAAPARGWASIMSAQLWPFATAIAAGHLLGLTPAIVDTATNATGGRANPLAIASGVAAILAVACLGYLLGSIWSSRIAPVVASLTVFPAIIGPVLLSDAVTNSAGTGTEGTSLYGVALSWLDVSVGIGREETVIGSTVRIALFSSIALAAVGLTVRTAGHNDTTPRWSTAVPMIAPAAIAAAILLVQPSLIARSTEPMVCQPVPRSEVCVPSEVADVLPPIAAGAAAVIDGYGYGAATADVDAGKRLSDLASFTYYADTAERAESEAAITAARLIGGEFACLSKAPGVGGDDALGSGGTLEEPFAFATELSYAIAIRSSASPANVSESLFSFDTETTRSLAALNDTELRMFLDRHMIQLANCTQTRVEQ